LIDDGWKDGADLWEVKVGQGEVGGRKGGVVYIYVCEKGRM
jgi:hypothetical protein